MSSGKQIPCWRAGFSVTLWPPGRQSHLCVSYRSWVTCTSSPNWRIGITHLTSGHPVLLAGLQGGEDSSLLLEAAPLTLLGGFSLIALSPNVSLTSTPCSWLFFLGPALFYITLKSSSGTWTQQPSLPWRFLSFQLNFYGFSSHVMGSRLFTMLVAFL